MIRCSFCGKEIEPGTGKVLFKNDGRTLNFDTSKCENNMLNLDRLPKEHKWTRAFRLEKQRLEETETANKAETANKK